MKWMGLIGYSVVLYGFYLFEKKNLQKTHDKKVFFMILGICWSVMVSFLFFHSLLNPARLMFFLFKPLIPILGK